MLMAGQFTMKPVDWNVLLALRYWRDALRLTRHQRFRARKVSLA
jgi:hypothetical protein